MMRKAVRFLTCASIAAVFLLPVVYTVTSSLGEGRGRLSLLPSPVQLDQYYWLFFQDGVYLHHYWNSIAITLSVCALNLASSFGVAYVLAKVRFKGRGVVLGLYVVMALMPFQVTLLPAFVVSKAMGLFDTWGALIYPGAFSPLGVLLLRQFMLAVPDELCECARLETKHTGQVLMHVVVPFTRYGIIALLLVCFAENWNMVEQPLVLLTDTWKYPLSAIMGSLATSRPSISFAASVFYMLPVFVLTALFSRGILEGVRGVKV